MNARAVLSLASVLVVLAGGFTGAILITIQAVGQIGATLLVGVQ